MAGLNKLMNKTRKMLRSFFGVARKPVTATKIVLKDAACTTKKVVKGAVRMAKKPVRVVMNPVKSVKGLAKSAKGLTKSAKKTVRATTRRLGRLVRF